MIRLGRAVKAALEFADDGRRGRYCLDKVLIRAKRRWLELFACNGKILAAIPLNDRDEDDVEAVGEGIVISAEALRKLFSIAETLPLQLKIGTDGYELIAETSAGPVSGKVEKEKSGELMPWPNPDVFPKGEPQFTVKYNADYLAALCQLVKATVPEGDRPEMTLEFYGPHDPAVCKCRNVRMVIMPIVAAKGLKCPTESKE